MLAIDDASVRRGSRLTLRGVSVVIESGITTLLGANGAGKSTLISTMLGLIPLNSGSVRHHGEVVASHAQWRAVRRTIGWLPQGFAAVPGMRVEEFVAYAAWLKEVPRARTRTAVSEALALTDLETLRGARVGRISGGERQRAGLAAALVAQPSVLMLDEPTAGLDPLQRHRFHDTLERVCQDMGVHGVLVSTHLFEDVVGSADRVVVLAGGVVTARLARDDMLASGSDLTVEDVQRAVLAPMSR